MSEAPFRILVVDDEPENILLLRQQLEGEAFEIIAAEDGDQAILAFEADKPDLVLLDIMLPGTSGFEVCRVLKEKNSRLPVLMLTALVSDETKMEAFSAGADAYLVKPIDFSELLGQLKYFQDLQSYTIPLALASGSNSNLQCYQPPIDEIFRDLTERSQPNQRTLYQICSQNRSGYVAVINDRFIYAHTDELDGREALEKMLQWPAATFENIVRHDFESNCEIPIGEVRQWWFQQLPVWRLMLEELPPKQAVLFLDPHRVGELDGLSLELRQEAVLFTQGLCIDQVLKRPGGNITESLRRVAELYYLRYLVNGENVSIDMLNVPVESATSSSLISQRFSALSISSEMEEPFESETAEVLLGSLKMELMGLSATADQLRQENADLRALVRMQESEFFQNDRGQQAPPKGAELAKAVSQKPPGKGSHPGHKKNEDEAHWQRKFADAEQALAQAEKESQDREIQAKALREKNLTLSDDVLTLKEQLEEREIKLNRATAAEVSANGELAQMKARLAKLEKELAVGKSNGEQLSKLQAELDAERGKTKKLTEQNADLTAKKEKATQAESTAKDALRQEQARLAKIEKDTAASSTNKALLTKLELALDTERVKAKRTAQEMDELNQKLAGLQKELKAKAGASDSQEKQIRDLQRDHDDQIQSKEMAIRKLQSEAEQARFRVQEVETARKQFENQIAQVKTQLIAAASEASQWREQFLKTVDGSKSEMNKATDIIRQFAEVKGRLEVAQANTVNSQNLAGKLEKELAAARQELGLAKRWHAKALVAAGTFFLGAVLASMITALVIRPSNVTPVTAAVAAPVASGSVAGAQPVAAVRPEEARKEAAIVVAPAPSPSPVAVAPQVQERPQPTEPVKEPVPPKAQTKKSDLPPKAPAPEKHPDSGKEKAGALQKEGRAAYNAGNFPKAIGIFKEAIELDASSSLYSDLGKAFYDGGDAAKAEEAYRRALRISEGNAEAHLGTGMILAERGDNMKAKKEFKKFLSLAPHHPLVDQVKSVLSQMQ